MSDFEVHNRGEPSSSFRAFRQASQSRNPKLITSNIDEEYKKAVKNTQPENLITKIPSSTGGLIQKFGGKRCASAYGVDRVFDAPHSPFRTIAAVETPQNIVELYSRFRYYMQREPLVATAIELHSEFPLSSFQVQHEDSALQEFFNDMIENLNLFEFLISMAMEYHIIGECFPHGILDDPKDPTMWTGFILLNPLNINIESVPMTDGRSNIQMRLTIDEKLKTVIANGPNDLKTGELYKKIPSDIIDTCKKSSGFLPLNSIQTSHLKRKGSYFKTRGESMLFRIMHLLAYRDKLRDAQYALADRYISPREIWKVGEPTNPATEEELIALSDMVSSTYRDPSQAVIWHHALQVDVVGGYDKVLPVRQELDGVENEMLVGLGLNKGFLDSSYGAYANMSVSLDVLISRYLIFRQHIERWLIDHVFAPICRIHNIYKPTNAELAHRIRIKNPTKRPWTPKILWEKHELRDNTQKVRLLMELREKLGKPGFPREIIYQTLNYNAKTINKLIDKEAKDDLIRGTQVNLKGGPGGPGAMPGMPGGDMGLPIDNLNSPIGEIPGGGSASPESGKPKDTDLGSGVQVKPESSQQAQGFGTGLGQ